MVSPPLVIDRYALYDEIASGGMATVYFGRLIGPVGFSRTVAIKRLHPQFAKDPEFVAMFTDEACLAARVRHPNVVATLDVVATESELFLVMDYVQGESLVKLARGAKIPPRIVSAIMCGILHGLHAAHEAVDEHGVPLQIVHRDVSPHNILVGTDGVARLLDFGIAKAASRSQVTREGYMKGKISYMAPEQVRGSVSRQTDIYAASIVTWEALVGERLFNGDDQVATLMKIVTGEIRPPSQVADVPAVFDDVIMRGLAGEPDKRWQTAREMAQALEQCVGVASLSEVSDWVNTAASESLSKRRLTISAIESTPVQLVTQRSPSSVRNPVVEPTLVLPETQEPGEPQQPGEPQVVNEASVNSTGMTSMSVVSWLPPPPRRRLGVLGVALAVFATLVGIGFWVNASLQGTDSRALGVPSSKDLAVPSAPLTSLSTPPPSVQPSTATPGVLVDPAPSTAAIASSDSSLGTSPKTVPFSSPRPSPAPSSRNTSIPKPAVAKEAPPAKPSDGNCSPPYTLDPMGHRRYKMECL